MPETPVGRESAGTHETPAAETSEAFAAPPSSTGSLPLDAPSPLDTAPGEAAPALDAVPALDTAPPSLGRVELFEDSGLAWQPVSPRLATARIITMLLWLVPILVALAVTAVLWTGWLWVPAAVVLLGIGWALWLIPRQVSAMSYVELAEDLVIRKGRVLRVVTSVPFGRLQYVDLQSGPLERKLGMATLQIFTASPSTSATIPGLPIQTAEQMRERLMQRGEAQRAGL